MQHISETTWSLGSLVGRLRDETKMLIKEEVQLAKAEVSESLGRAKSGAVSLLLGGFIAYTGLILLLVGIGFLLAHLFEDRGTAPLLAAFFGLGILGVLAAVAGYVFIAGGLKKFSAVSLKPERAIANLKEIKSGELAPTVETVSAKTHIEKMDARVDQARERIDQTTREIRHRLSPRYMLKSAVVNVKAHPWRAGLFGALSSVLGILLVRRRLARRHGVA